MSTPRKRFAHTSNTWQFFQKYFFLDNDKYPYILGPFQRGKAINLVQGLNCCNIQWADEQSMPHSFLTLSAKAKRGGDPPDSLWHVEISTNYKKQGLASPSKRGRAGTDWMTEYLARDNPEGGESAPSSPPDTTSSSSKGDTTSSPDGRAGSSRLPPSEGRAGSSGEPASEPEISHMENALEGWLRTGRTRTPADTDEANAAAGALTKINEVLK